MFLFHLSNFLNSLNLWCGEVLRQKVHEKEVERRFCPGERGRRRKKLQGQICINFISFKSVFLSHYQNNISQIHGLFKFCRWWPEITISVHSLFVISNQKKGKGGVVTMLILVLFFFRFILKMFFTPTVCERQFMKVC